MRVPRDTSQGHIVFCCDRRSYGYEIDADRFAQPKRQPNMQRKLVVSSTGTEITSARRHDTQVIYFQAHIFHITIWMVAAVPAANPGASPARRTWFHPAAWVVGTFWMKDIISTVRNRNSGKVGFRQSMNSTCAHWYLAGCVSASIHWKPLWVERIFWGFISSVSICLDDTMLTSSKTSMLLPPWQSMRRLQKGRLESPPRAQNMLTRNVCATRTILCFRSLDINRS